MLDSIQMATPQPSCHFLCNFAPLAKSPSQINFSSSFLPPFILAPCGSISRCSVPSNFISRSKFKKFDGESSQDTLEGESFAALHQQQLQQTIQVNNEDDGCLPSDMVGAVMQSGEAAAAFVSSGGMRAIVELLIPKLYMANEGAQAEVWELSRIFMDTLVEKTGCQSVKAIFPDAGAAAMLKNQWNDAVFGFASLGDRKPVLDEDEIVVMVVPDYQMLKYVEQISLDLSDNLPRPLIMWNPRLISQDVVGIGLNVRNLRKYFLSSFTTVYYMKPLESGAVFRCYPGLWKVFYDDKNRVGRYLLAQEQFDRPNSEDVEILLRETKGGSTGNEPSLFSKAAETVSSVFRFMKAISRA